ncbi:NAD-dependent epimerase/dehydratase family protein [Cohnella yongneupensis]|uniref:NAD-dependent epimerase/dehydratase family protein n=1 Tax=Cohnella yongneupensis TaxID=425006 RepID=A0ABW0R1V4_9BACL
MNCLVLGGGGFIGTHICEGLLREGHHVRVLGRTQPDKANKLILDNVEWIMGDFSNLETIKKSMMNIDIIFHLVSTTNPKTSNDSPIIDMSSNVIPTLQLLDAAKDQGIKKIIFASSGGTVYGKPSIIPIPETHPTFPTSSYGIHKLTVEKYLHMYFELYGLDYSVMRISNPYGEGQLPDRGQGVVATFLNRSLKNEKIEIWGDGSVIRDYIYISDVVSAAIKLLDYEGKEKIFNIGSGVGKTLIELIEIIEHVANTTLNVNYIGGRKLDVPVNVLDIQRAKKLLLWEPKMSLFEGIERTKLMLK